MKTLFYLYDTQAGPFNHSKPATAILNRKMRRIQALNLADEQGVFDCATSVDSVTELLKTKPAQDKRRNARASRRKETVAAQPSKIHL